MTGPVLLSRALEINTRGLTKQEILLLEAELFVLVCKELKEIFRKEQKNYFRLIKLPSEMESVMLESNFTRLIIWDVLETEEYTLTGIARYTNTHEEVVNDIYFGININPSASFLQKLIDLHRMVRRDLYNAILKKIKSNYILP